MKGFIMSEEQKIKISISNRGKKRTEEQKRKISEATKVAMKNPAVIKKMIEGMKKAGKYGLLGEKHPSWKGDDAKVSAKHMWIRDKFGNPKYCEVCRRTDKKIYHWSSKDHIYTRNRKDWQRLCPSCHKNYDNKSSVKKVIDCVVCGKIMESVSSNKKFCSRHCKYIYYKYYKIKL